MQAPIDGLIELAIAHDIHPDEVTRVEVAVLQAGWPLVCQPPERKYSPSSTVDAQFSMPFGAAMALTYRTVGLDQFSEDNFQSSQIRTLMGKVVMTKDNRIEQNFPAEWPAHVEVHLKNGKQLEKYVRFPKGDPENPLSWEELSAKFCSLAVHVLPASRCEQINDSIRELNQSAVLSDIWKLTAPSAPSVIKPIRSTAPRGPRVFGESDLDSHTIDHEVSWMAGEERTWARIVTVIMRPRWQTGHSRKERPVSLSYRSR